jgi:hypothetical protein
MRMCTANPKRRENRSNKSGADVKKTPSSIPAHGKRAVQRAGYKGSPLSFVDNINGTGSLVSSKVKPSRIRS